MHAVPEKCRLLHGPYQPPGLQRGDRATCHLRGDVRITSWADARISWPRCQVLKGRGGCGLLLDDELARAVRTESAAAVMYWWGFTEGVVWRWRRVLEVTKTNNKRTHQLMKQSAQAGAGAVKAKVLETPAQRDQNWPRRKRGPAAELQGQWWTRQECRLLGRYSDAEVARLTGRTLHGIRNKRLKLGRKSPSTSPWSDEEITMLGTAPDSEIAATVGRSCGAVAQKRQALGIPSFVRPEKP